MQKFTTSSESYEIIENKNGWLSPNWEKVQNSLRNAFHSLCLMLSIFILD